MPHARDSFLAPTEHRRPRRVLDHAGSTPDLKRRVIEPIGTDDIRAQCNRYWDEPDVVHELSHELAWARRYPTAWQSAPASRWATEATAS